MNQIEKAVDILQNKGIIVYPTETAYALGCDARDHDAVAKVFMIKQRPHDMTVPLIVSSLEMAEQFADFSEKARELAKQYWPGPLTLVLPVKAGVELSHLTIAQDNTIAIRVSSNPVAHELAEQLGAPIVSTSANLNGGKVCYSTTAALAQLREHWDSIGFIINEGDLAPEAPSTIVRVKGDLVEVLRQGEIKL